MKFLKGIQMCVHPEFHKEFKELKNARVITGKEKNGELSDRRFFLTIAKAIKNNQNKFRDMLISADIDLMRE